MNKQGNGIMSLVILDYLTMVPNSTSLIEAIEPFRIEFLFEAHSTD